MGVNIFNICLYTTKILISFLKFRNILLHFCYYGRYSAYFHWQYILDKYRENGFIVQRMCDKKMQTVDMNCSLMLHHVDRTFNMLQLISCLKVQHADVDSTASAEQSIKQLIERIFNIIVKLLEL